MKWLRRVSKLKISNSSLIGWNKLRPSLIGWHNTSWYSVYIITDKKGWKKWKSLFSFLVFVFWWFFKIFLIGSVVLNRFSLKNWSRNTKNHVKPNTVKNLKCKQESNDNIIGRKWIERNWFDTCQPY